MSGGRGSGAAVASSSASLHHDHEAALADAERERNWPEVARILNVFGDELRRTGDRDNIRKALRLHAREVRISDQYLPHPVEGAIARRFKGDCHRELGELREAISEYKAALRVLRNIDEPVEQQRLQCDLGIAYQALALAEFDADAVTDVQAQYHLMLRALPAFERSLATAQTIRRSLGESGRHAGHARPIDVAVADKMIYEAHFNIGCTYRLNEDFSEALQALDAAVQYATTVATADARALIAKCYHECGLTHMATKSAAGLATALTFLQKDLTMCRQAREKAGSAGVSPDAWITEAKTLRNIAQVNFQQGDMAPAETFVRQALSCLHKAGPAAEDEIQAATEDLSVYRQAVVELNAIQQTEAKLKAAVVAKHTKAALKILLGNDDTTGLIDHMDTIDTLRTQSRVVELLRQAIAYNPPAATLLRLQHSLCDHLYHLRRFHEAREACQDLVAKLDVGVGAASLETQAEAYNLYAGVLELDGEPIDGVQAAYEKALSLATQAKALDLQVRVLDGLLQAFNTAGRPAAAKARLPELKALNSQLHPGAEPSPMKPKRRRAESTSSSSSSDSESVVSVRVPSPPVPTQSQRRRVQAAPMDPIDLTFAPEPASQPPIAADVTPTAVQLALQTDLDADIFRIQCILDEDCQEIAKFAETEHLVTPDSGGARVADDVPPPHYWCIDLSQLQTVELVDEDFSEAVDNVSHAMAAAVGADDGATVQQHLAACGDNCNYLGHIFAKCGEDRHAALCHRQDLLISTVLGNVEGQAVAFRNIGVALKDAGYLVGALRNLREAVRLSSGDHGRGFSSRNARLQRLHESLVEVGLCLSWWYQAWQDGGDNVRDPLFATTAATALVRCRTIFEAALQLARQVGAVDMQTVALCNVGMCLLLGADPAPEEALKHLQQALRLAPNASIRSRALFGLGQACVAMGKHKQAVDYFRKDIQTCHGENDLEGELTSMQFLLNVLETHGSAKEYSGAASLFRSTLRKLPEPDAELTEICEYHLKNAERVTDLARIVHELDEATTSGNTLQQHLSYAQICQLCASANPEQALQYGQQWRYLAVQQANVLWRAQADDALGFACMQLGRLEEACEHFQNAVTAYRQCGEHRGLAVTLNDLGTATEKLSVPSRLYPTLEARQAAARSWYEMALDQATKLNDPSLMRIITANAHMDEGTDADIMVDSEPVGGDSEPLSSQAFARPQPLRKPAKAATKHVARLTSAAPAPASVVVPASTAPLATPDSPGLLLAMLGMGDAPSASISSTASSMKRRVFVRVADFTVSLDMDAAWTVAEASAAVEREAATQAGAVAKISAFRVHHRLMSPNEGMAAVVHSGEALVAVISAWEPLALQAVYTSRCAAAGGMEPSARVHALFAAADAIGGDVHLNLHDVGLTPRQLVPVLQSLAYQSRVVTLDLSNNFLDMACISALSTSLTTVFKQTQLRGPQLHTLHLSGCCLDDATLSQLLQAVSRSCGSGLESLDLSFNAIGRTAAPVLCDLLRSAPQIQYVRLQRCGLSNLASQQVVESLELSTSLLSLELGGNHMDDATVASILSRLLREHPQLQQADVSAQALITSTAFHVSQVIATSVATAPATWCHTLNIRGLKLTPDAVTSLQASARQVDMLVQ